MLNSTWQWQFVRSLNSQLHLYIFLCFLHFLNIIHISFLYFYCTIKVLNILFLLYFLLYKVVWFFTCSFKISEIIKFFILGNLHKCPGVVLGHFNYRFGFQIVLGYFPALRFLSNTVTGPLDARGAPLV